MQTVSFTRTETTMNECLARLLSTVIEWPKTTTLLALALAFTGAYLSRSLAVDVFPDIKVPRITIQTEEGPGIELNRTSKSGQ